MAVFFGKFYAKVHEAMDGGSGVFYHELNGFFVVVVGAGFQSVFNVLFDVIGFIENGGNASLGVVGAGIDHFFLSDNEDLAFFGCM